MSNEMPQLGAALGGVDEAVAHALESRFALSAREVGRVLGVGEGVASVEGLPDVRSQELVRFPGGQLGMVLNLDPEIVGVVLLDSGEGIQAGDEVRRTGRVMDVPVGGGIIGRVVDPAGRPVDGRGPVRTSGRLPIERPAPGVLQRDPVSVPLQTGIKVVDALVPIGRGQRELIVGDRQTGKTTIAIDAILNQAGFDVVCLYCSIGQRESAAAKAVATLRHHGAMKYTAVVVCGEEQPPGLRYAAPYAAMSMAEHFMQNGRDVLLVLDDLTRHARAYRELSLLLRRPPGREAFPGDIFYIHSRLLERATHLREDLGGGSLSALPIIETQAQNISAYIPTNLIGITDGQIYLNPTLFQQGQLPAVDVGRSVSRVGGRAQLKAYREVAGDLRLAYSQFQELERFSRYGTRLEEKQRRRLEHGRRVREVLKQDEHENIPAAEQVAVLFAVDEGLLDDVPVSRIGEAQTEVRETLRRKLPDVAEHIAGGRELTDEDRTKLRKAADEALKGLRASDRQGASTSAELHTDVAEEHVRGDD